MGEEADAEGRGIGVRVLGRGCGKGPAAEQLGAALVVGGVLALGLERVGLGAKLRELVAEVAQTLVGLLLLGGVELLLCQGRVFVQRAREGGQGGG